MPRKAAYKIIVHLKEPVNGVDKLYSSSFEQVLKVSEGVIALYKTDDHSYFVPLSNVAYGEFIKDRGSEE